MNNLILPPEFQKPKVETETTEINRRDNSKVEKADHHLKVAGDSLAPAGMVYVGTAATHIYRDPREGRTFTFISHTPIGDAHEVWVERAFQGLKEHCMKMFGRTAPAKVKR